MFVFVYAMLISVCFNHGMVLTIIFITVYIEFKKFSALADLHHSEHMLNNIYNILKLQNLWILRS